MVAPKPKPAPQKKSEPDTEFQVHANNAYRIMRIEGAFMIRPHGKIVALDSSGREKVLYENKTDREQILASGSGNIFIKAS